MRPDGLYREYAKAGGSAWKPFSARSPGVSGEYGADPGAGFKASGDSDAKRGDVLLFAECEGGAAESGVNFIWKGQNKC